MNIKKIFFRFLYHLTKKKEFRNIYKYDYNLKNNKIILIENGEKKVLPPYAFVKGFNIVFLGSNNTVEIELPNYAKESYICFYNNNNFVHIGQNMLGNIFLHLNKNGNEVKIGRRVEASGFGCTLHGDKLLVGDNCMFSNSIKLWTDGHSVIDDKTKELLNPSGHTIIIGNHVWIGEDVVLLKNTQIPSNSIVAHSSVVTKKFEEENIVLAGNPASIVKRGINWCGESPNYYDKSTADLTF